MKVYVSLFTFVKFFFKCRNAGLSVIWSVRYQNEQECRCRNQSGTGLRGPSPVLECSGNGLRYQMPECRCRWHWHRCQCPAMHVRQATQLSAPELSRLRYSGMYNVHVQYMTSQGWLYSMFQVQWLNAGKTLEASWNVSSLYMGYWVMICGGTHNH